MTSMSIDTDYFAKVAEMVNSPSYNEGHILERGKYILSMHEESKTASIKIKNHLDLFGFCVINFSTMESKKWLASWQQSFLGEIMVNKNPKNLPYARIAVKPNSCYFADSNKAQPLHTDEGYTTIAPHYVSLFCEENDALGGLSTLVPVDQILAYFSEFSNILELGYAKSALLLNKADISITKPLFFRYGNDCSYTGITYSTMVKKITLLKKLASLFLQLTKFIHEPSNQIRVRLMPNDLLIIDNFRMLHGRTSFALDSMRTMFRYWFSPHKIG